MTHTLRIIIITLALAFITTPSVAVDPYDDPLDYPGSPYEQ